MIPCVLVNRGRRGCRRLINLTCRLLLPYPVRSDTHCIFKTCIKTPPSQQPPSSHHLTSTPSTFPCFLFFFFFCGAQSKHGHFFINRQIIQTDRIVIYANDRNVGRRFFPHRTPPPLNERCLSLTVIRFTAVYICTIVDGHGEQDGDIF